MQFSPGNIIINVVNVNNSIFSYASHHMIKVLLLPLVFVLFLFMPPGAESRIAKREAISCSADRYYTLATLPRIKHPRLVYPDDKSDYPLVVANDNTIPAGKLFNNTLELNLEVVWSDFYIETNQRPGLRVVTIAE